MSSRLLYMSRRLAPSLLDSPGLCAASSSTTTTTPSIPSFRTHYSTTTTMAASSSTPTAMQNANRLQRAFAANNGASFGIWQMFPGTNVSRALARSDPDWIMVDCEHGNIDDAAMHEAVPAIAASGVSPLVRIPDQQSWMLKRVLDAGAHGVLVPLVRSVEEVRAVVAATKFPPQGTRGFGSPLAMHTFAPAPSFTEYLQQANGALLTLVQIETREALEVVEEIAPLVDGLFVGPFDLGNSIGFPILDGVVRPELTAAIERILSAAHAAGKKCGMFATSGEEAAAYAKQGFDMINVGTDLTTLEFIMKQSMAVAKGSAGPEKGKGYGS